MIIDSVSFLDACRNKRLVIFGAGFVAGMFLRALELHGLTGQIDRFEVTSARPGQTFRGYEVRSLARDGGGADGELFCIAVHEQAMTPAELAALAEGRDAVFLYPILHALLFGPPLETGIRLPLRTILRAQPEDRYWLAARAAGMDGTTEGEQIYRKAIGLLSSPATTGRRLEAARSLFRSIETNGLDPAFPVVLDEDLQIIDGLHRTAAGVLTGAAEISCTVYARSPVCGELLTDRNRLKAGTLESAGFTPREIELLKETDRKLRRMAEASGRKDRTEP